MLLLLIIILSAEPTSSASVPGSSTAKPKLRDFSIPLKPLPAQSSANCKILHAKSQVATVSRYV